MAPNHNSLDTSHTDVLCSIVVVSFRSADTLGGCLDMLGRGTRSPFAELIVLNNSQDDRDAIQSICLTRNAKFVQNAQNLGYGAACNVGGSLARGRYVLFLNPDVRISLASVELLIGLAEANKDMVALGPLQSGRRGTLRGKRRAVGVRRARSNRTLRKLSPASTVTETSFLSGGALMVRKAAFDRIGGFDENLFLFHEDDDLCLRIAGLGRLAYASGVVALHESGSSTPKSAGLTRLRAWHLGYSKVYVLRKHYGTRAGYLPLFDAALNFLSPAMLTRRGRVKATGFLAGVLSSLRSEDISLDAVPA